MATRPLRTLGVLVLSIVAGYGGSLLAQGTGASTDVLHALLVEVRGLRAAMEQMVSAGPRIELALGRLQLQEQRVNGLIRRHEDVRERLAIAERESSELGHRVETTQAELQEVTHEPDRRAELEGALREFKRVHSAKALEVQRLRTEETEAAQLLSAEQNRWTEINQRLEELERALTRR